VAIQLKPAWTQRIKQARENKGISQRELVKRLGINQTSLVFYETGRREPKIGFLIGLIQETGVNGNWLLTGKGEMYGEGKKIITEEEAIKALFADKADEVVLYLIDAIKDPFLKAIMFTRASEYKEQHKNRYDKAGDASKS
jgi:transcriptional regulator with XRE-family HTH domain